MNERSDPVAVSSDEARERAAEAQSTIALACGAGSFRWHEKATSARFTTSFADCGGGNVAMIAHSASRYVRSGDDIRSTDPEFVKFSLYLSPQGFISQRGTQSAVPSGSWVVSGTYQSQELVFEHAAKLLVLSVPRSRLGSDLRRLESAFARPLHADRRMAKAFSHLGRAILSSNASPEARRLAYDGMTSIALAEILTVLRDDPSATGLFRAACRTIDERLGDFGLTPAQIADIHHVSLRTLQRAFAEEHTTPAGWIRHRRMSAIAQELRRTPGVRVAEVAQRWGVLDVAHLSRDMKRTLGISPSAQRVE